MTIPELPGPEGRTYFCEDSNRQWHYLNHAGRWVTCPPPFKPKVLTLEDRVQALEKQVAALKGGPS